MECEQCGALMVEDGGLLYCGCELKPAAQGG